MKNRLIKLLLYSFAIAVNVTQADTASQSLDYRIVDQFVHDKTIFTQGLAFYQTQLFESSGLYGQSFVISRTLENSTPLHQHVLDKTFFAEGLTVLNHRVYQLSWKAGTMLVYQPTTLKLIERHHYSGEGWGLCNNGKQLIMSNGSAQLRFYDASPFKLTRSITVLLNGKPLEKINELEWVEGKIYANVWFSNYLYIIDPLSGNVESTVDLTKLRPITSQYHDNNVLNGIAYETQQKRLFVTGKYWPTLFQIEILKNP